MTVLDFDAHVNSALAVVADFTEDERAEAWLASLPAGTQLTGASQGVPVTLTVDTQGCLLGAYRWTFASALYYFGPLAVAE